MSVHVIEELEVVDIDHADEHRKVNEVAAAAFQCRLVFQSGDVIVLAFFTQVDEVLEVTEPDLQEQKNQYDTSDIGFYGMERVDFEDGGGFADAVQDKIKDEVSGIDDKGPYWPIEDKKRKDEDQDEEVESVEVS